MPDNDLDKQLEFLYQAIGDAQDIIRFTDTKTGFCVTLVAAIIAVIFSQFNNLITHYPYFSLAVWIALATLVLMIFLSLLIIMRILKPTRNPLSNVIGTKVNNLKVSFYLADNAYNGMGKVLFPFVNRGKFRIVQDLAAYRSSLRSASQEDLIDTMTLELFKVSFIRNIKTDRFIALTRLLLLTVTVFIIFYLLYLSELPLIDIGHNGQ